MSQGCSFMRFCAYCFDLQSLTIHILRKHIGDRKHKKSLQQLLSRACLAYLSSSLAHCSGSWSQHVPPWVMALIMSVPQLFLNPSISLSLYCIQILGPSASVLENSLKLFRSHLCSWVLSITCIQEFPQKLCKLHFNLQPSFFTQGEKKYCIIWQ